MNEQMTLFDLEKQSFTNNLQDLINEIIISHELPQNSIYIHSNTSSKGKNAGKETSKSICIFEPEYPPRKGAIEKLGKNFIIMNIKKIKNEAIELLIRNKQFESITSPLSAIIKTPKSDKTFTHVIFQNDNKEIYDYIKSNILYCLANYESNSSFGCCSKFIECSDARKCVHENKIYSMGCKYRMNLDAGRIFYGKNKNI